MASRPGMVVSEFGSLLHQSNTVLLRLQAWAVDLRSSVEAGRQACSLAYDLHT